MMKKVLLFAALFGALCGFAFAQAAPDGTAAESAPATVTAEETAAVPEAEASDEEAGWQWPSFMRTEGATTRTGFRSERTYFELGLIGANIGVSNSWMSIGELPNIGNFEAAGFLDKGDLALELGLFATPLNLKIAVGSLFTLKVNVGVDADIHIGTTEGTIDTIKNMQGLIDDIGNMFGPNANTADIADLIRVIDNLTGGLSVEGEAFGVLDIMGESTFLSDKLWIKAGPSVFLPVLYIPKQSITVDGYGNPNATLTGQKVGVASDGSVDAWTAFIGGGSPGVGIDLSVEARYAVWQILDAGVAMSGIPLVPAFMDHKQSFRLDMDFSVTLPSTDQILNGNLGDNIKTDFDYKFDDATGEKKSVLRPMRFNFYGIYKPFKSNLLLVRPDIGFSVKYPGSGDSSYTTFNWGINAQLNLPIILSVSAGIQLFEEAWINSVGLIFNFRAFELDLGVGLRGPTISSSWTAKGLNALIGFKFGW
jgi:hypothetical protein